MLCSSYIIENDSIELIVDDFKATWRSTFTYSSQTHIEYLLLYLPGSIMGIHLPEGHGRR